MRSRCYALTISLDRLEQCKCVELCELISIELATLKGYTIGHMEEGMENGYLHYHVMLYFENAIEEKSIYNYLGNIHCEPVNSYRRYRDYMKKDGPFFVDTLSNATLDNDIMNDLLTCECFEDFLIMHPNVISQIKNYKFAFELLQEKRDIK